MPYGAMLHFQRQVKSSVFEEERRRYCLPVLDPHLITCTEVKINETTEQTNSSLVKWKVLNVFEPKDNGTSTQIKNTGMYKVTIDYPSNNFENIRYRTNDQGQGAMVVKRHPDPDKYLTSIITAADDFYDGYASSLHRMMYGTDPDKSDVPKRNSYLFAAKCELASIKYRDNYRSSWRNVDFNLKNGVLRANVTDERCMNPRGPGVSGFKGKHLS